MDEVTYPRAAEDRRVGEDDALLHFVDAPTGVRPLGAPPMPSPDDPPGPVTDAARRLWRQDLRRRTDERLIEMQSDPEDWKDYLAEAEMTSVFDGID